MRFAFVLLFIPLAYCQDLDRVFRLTGTPDQRGRLEIATTLRTVGQVKELSIDEGAGLLTIHAGPGQVAFAEWLVPRLDHPPSSAQRYNVDGSPDDIAMVYPLANIRSVRGIQEAITTLRTVLSLQLVYNISSAYMLAFRGDASTVAQVEFLLPELDRAAQPTHTPDVSRFHITKPFRDFDTLTAYHLAHANSNLAVQEIVTNLRVVAGIQKIYNSHATLSICASQSDTQVAEWLIPRLDRTDADPGVNQLQMPGGKDDVIRVLYLPHLSGGNQIKPLFDSIRASAEMKKSFWMTVPAAVVVRGTSDAVKAAASLAEQADTAGQLANR